MKKTVLFAAFLCVASSAFAARWVPVAWSDDSEIQIDVDSIKEITGERLYWAKRIYKPARPVPGGSGSYDTLVSRGHIDCVRDTMYATSVSYYLGDAMVDSLPASTKFDIQPGSVAEAQEKVVCK